MIVKKIIIVPSERLVRQNKIKDNSIITKSKNVLNSFLRRHITYDAELQWYGDIPSILGRENVFTYGKYPHYFFSKSIPKYCPYPSCHGISKPMFINSNQLHELVRNVDVVLVSSRSGERGKISINESKRHDIPVAILDFNDHESLYGSNDIKTRIYRDFIPGKHFDLYFKKDLPLGFCKEKLLPLAPTPLRPDSYSFRTKTKKHNFFYSGTTHDDRCQVDRIEGVELLKNKFDDVLTIEHGTNKTFLSTQEYWDYFSKSKIAFSPSGRSWDSFRHCEIGLTRTTALLAPVPYIETVPPYLEDGENAILYETELRGNKYYIKNKDSFLEKINFYLENIFELNKIATNWFEDVNNGHTILARSKYILESLENNLR